jgi:hypothetical protein
VSGFKICTYKKLGCLNKKNGMNGCAADTREKKKYIKKFVGKPRRENKSRMA